MAQGFTKLPTSIKKQKPTKKTITKKGRMNMQPKHKSAIISEQIRKKFTAKINKKIEESSIAKAGSNLTILNPNKK